MGVLDCESRRVKLPPSVRLKGELGLSALQALVMSDWHPVKVVAGAEQLDPDDHWVQAIEGKYPEQGVSEFVVKVWQELQQFNASGGYSVEIPWHRAEERELTPAEVTEIMMRKNSSRRRPIEQATMEARAASAGAQVRRRATVRSL